MSPGRFRIVIWVVVLAAAAGFGGYGLRVHKRSQSVERYMEAAAKAEHRGDLAAAAKAYKGALQADARYLPARTGLADVYKAEGKLAEALAEHRRGVAADPGNADAHEALARGLIECRRYPEAIECLERGIKAAPRGGAHMRLVLQFCYRRNGDVEKAKQELAEVEKAEPGSTAVRNAMRAMQRQAKKKQAGEPKRAPKAGAETTSRAAKVAHTTRPDRDR